jgi:protein-tyrosine phosphatase
MSGDTGANTVEKTYGWVAPDGADPFTHWIDGIAHMGNTPFSMPIITHVTGNLWHGGYVDNLDLGDRFDTIVSLYPWEKYPTKGDTVQVTMYDSTEVDGGSVEDAALFVVGLLAKGQKVLVHCQAGLNRSSLVVARALMYMGQSADEAIAMLREKRSPAVLCNETFEKWLRSRE